LRFLDASRGLTMIFVLLSHFGLVYFTAPEQQTWRAILVRVGMVATPTFVILSGVVLGVQHYMSRASFGRIKARYIDRGLFLLLFGHLVIKLAIQRFEHGGSELYITDVIGVAMILGGVLVPKLGTWFRLSLSVVIYVGSWLTVYFWQPAALSSETIKELLFGSLTPTVLLGVSFPVAPWFALYLASSVLGERLADMAQSGSIRRSWSELALCGACGVSATIGIKLVALQLGLSHLMGHVTTALLRVGQKWPPAPLYLMFYGGVGLLLMSGCLAAEKRQWCRRMFSGAAICGEASLFVFLAHFYLYYLGLYRLGPGGPASGLVYFILSTTALVVAAHVWQGQALNRIFTVRFPAAYERLPGSVRRLRMDSVPVLWAEQPR